MGLCHRDKRGETGGFGGVLLKMYGGVDKLWQLSQGARIPSVKLSRGLSSHEHMNKEGGQ